MKQLSPITTERNSPQPAGALIGLALVGWGLWMLAACGCESPGPANRSVHQAPRGGATNRSSSTGALAQVGGSANRAGELGHGGKAESFSAVMATVNGEPITRGEVAEQLLRGRGESVLETMIQLEVVRQAAREEGIDPERRQRLFEAEMTRTLEDIAGGQSPSQQRAILEYLLESRGLSEPEFAMIIEQQCLLREMVDHEVTVTDDALEQEAQRLYGRRVTVRVLESSQLRTAEQALRRAGAGESFAALVGELSEDQASLARDGLLGPFSRNDEGVASPIRQAAFELGTVGEISEIITLPATRDAAERFVILELVESHPARAVNPAEKREELIRHRRNRVINQRMQTLLRTLQSEAVIERSTNGQR